MKKVLAFFRMLWYYMRAVGRQQQINIRVWRSLVSRLNGVQEASSSNLDTRTIKAERAFALSAFIFCEIRTIKCNCPVDSCLPTAGRRQHYDSDSPWESECSESRHSAYRIFISKGCTIQEVDIFTLKCPPNTGCPVLGGHFISASA